MPCRPASQPRARIRAAQAIGAFAAVTGVVLGGSYAASAEPTGPSQAEVDGARSAVAAAGTQVAALDASYAAASRRLAAVRERSAALGEAANGARWELEKATAAALDARRKSDAAAHTARGARDELREFAAGLYQQDGALGTLGSLLDAGDPQQLLDRASTLEIVSDQQDARLGEALRLSGTAQTLQAAADEAEKARRSAFTRAEQAERIARAEFDLADAEASRLQRTRAGLAERLAALRDTSVRLERERLDAIAAEAAAQEAAAQEAAQAANEPPTSAPPASGTATPPVATGTSTRPTSSATRPTATSTSPRPTSTSTPPTSTSSSTRPTSTSTSTRPTSTSTSTRPTSTSTSTRPTTTSSSTPPPTSTSTSTPPPASGAAAAIAYAQAQLGKPYLWGGSGPDAFDCSGLTMMAWRQAGVYLSHYTGAQYAETARVPIDQLQPGDLVFFGSSGESSHHMGLYVGGGQMIEAPYTGAVIRYASIYRSDLVPYGGRPG
ncbi:C40 family peptidase [Nostocoides australiense]|nr:NlpC/P60 family protein [Tetrasphaera australiensis]